jgi:hypothetical protein
MKLSNPLRFAPLAALLLVPLHAQTLPATERKPFDEGKKEHLWEDRATITGTAKAPASEKLLWYRKPAREWTEAPGLDGASDYTLPTTITSAP